MSAELDIELLKRMTEAFGPSGFERDVNKTVREYVEDFASEILVDKLGSVAFKVPGKVGRPKILVAGHVDEVGFVASGIDKDTGFVSFNPLGGWFDQVLLSQRVVVRTRKGDVPGIIAAKPPHLLTREEREKVVTKDKMFIDVGTTSKEETEQLGVRIGDPIVPWSPFTLIGDGKAAIAKGFDDRIGAFVAIEALKRIRKKKIEVEADLYGAATVQEEVGLRGAMTVAHLINPDVAIVAEVDIAGDAPGIKVTEAPARMGKGPTILTYDASMIPNQPLKELVIRTAEEAKIPYQLSQIARGGTDAGRIHVHGVGCPSIVIGVPTRHIHTSAGIIYFQDVENTVRLIVEVLKKLDERTVKNLTEV